jgi:hypothetical protein
MKFKIIIMETKIDKIIIDTQEKDDHVEIINVSFSNDNIYPKKMYVSELPGSEHCSLYPTWVIGEICFNGEKYYLTRAMKNFLSDTQPNYSLFRYANVNRF